MSLVSGKPVYCRRYNAGTGLFSPIQRVRENDVVIVSGLHPFFAPVVAKNYDVGVFTEVEVAFKAGAADAHPEDGNHVRHQFLSHSLGDYTRYLTPQRKAANLIFSLPIVSGNFKSMSHSSARSAGLCVLIREGLYHEKIARVLIGICGLRLDVKLQEDLSIVEMRIEGELSADDVRLATAMVAPEIGEILAPKPGWRGGTVGLMQLFVLTHIDQALRSRA